MENHRYRDLMGRGRVRSRRRRRPTSTARSARDCGVATNYHAVSRPSLPNYIALVAGSRCGGLDGLHQLRQRGRKRLPKIAAAGRSWRAGCPSGCRRAPRLASWQVVKRHNPATYFPAVASDCARWDVPIGGSSGHLAEALSGGKHAYSMVVPNAWTTCTTARSQPAITGWRLDPAHHPYRRLPRRLGTAVFVVWDERGQRLGGEDSWPSSATRAATVQALVLSA